MSIMSKDFAFFAPRRSIFEGDLEASQTRRDYRRTPPRVWDFDNGDLLLLQDDKGDCWWASQADLWKNDEEVTLRRICFFNGQIQQIVADRALCIMDTDTRLSDLDLLSSMSKSPRQLTHNACKTDFVSTRLARSQDVVIFTRLANGEKEVDEGATADYGRAKSDMRRDKKDTRNMRRFCDRHGPVGIGPSDLTKRVTHGKITDRESRSPSATDEDMDSMSGTIPPSTTDLWQIPTFHPNLKREFRDPYGPKGRKRSIAYRLLQLVRASPARLEAEQLRSEPEKARLEKRPEGWEAPTPAKRSMRASMRNLRTLISPKKSKTKESSTVPSPSPNMDGIPGDSGILNTATRDDIDDDEASASALSNPAQITETDCSKNPTIATFHGESNAAGQEAEAAEVGDYINYHNTHPRRPIAGSNIVLPPTAPATRQPSTNSIFSLPAEIAPVQGTGGVQLDFSSPGLYWPMTEPTPPMSPGSKQVAVLVVESAAAAVESLGFSA